MSVSERFTAFFAAANDNRRPYPWQIALTEAVAASGRWPNISPPTGAGKSSAVDIHVFLVAEHAGMREIRRPPRRLVLVAPRRVLVDDHYERARTLARTLSEAPPGSLLAETAHVLAGLRTSKTDPDVEPPPIGVWRMRGGVSPDNGWRLEPAACQIICATPQMWGSRLLLRGYRASPRSRNLESGLIAYDTVAIIDEAHLHERLVETAATIAARSTDEHALQVVAMSATPREPGISLSSADLAEEALARRVNASKQIRVVEVDGWPSVPDAVIAAAVERAGRGTVGVFVNDVPTALRVADRLRENTGSTVELVCGRLRQADLTRLAQRRQGLLTAEGNPKVDYLVSTQSLEVGVDLDLPAMVSVIAPPSALAQRAGRLNRSGCHSPSAFTVVVPASLMGADLEMVASGPYSGGELADGVRWLAELAGDISPGRVSAIGIPLSDRPPLPKLRPTDLETFSMTSLAQSADPDPTLYIEDPGEQRVEIDIVARLYLDLEPSLVERMLLACPPRQHETATIPLRTKSSARVIDAAVKHAWVVRSGANGPTATRLGTRDDRERGLSVITIEELHNGDALVVPDGAAICTAGVVGLGDGTGPPEPLDDVLDLAPEGATRDHRVPMTPTDLAEVLNHDPTLGSRNARRELADVLEAAGETDLPRLLRRRRLAELKVTWCGDAEVERGLLIVSEMQSRAEQTPLASEEVHLEQHLLDVEQRAEAILKALALDLPDPVRGAVTTAARLHDEGKRHPRFQARMGAGEIPLAKPRPGHRPDRGDRWRHEQLSAAYASRESGRAPLVVALVAGHHGHGRMLFDRDAVGILHGWSDCPAHVRAETEHLFGPFGSYELMRAAAQREHGIHGLAWLEAIVRCADMQVSREGK